MDKYPKNGFFHPSLNDGNHIFVFGSNESGMHGKGAALTAKRFWGAISGIGDGLQGNSYGIPTKDKRLKVLGLGAINRYVKNFIQYAKCNPKLVFLVTRIGCGLAGYDEDEISPMFKDAPSNCILPPKWRE